MSFDRKEVALNFTRLKMLVDDPINSSLGNGFRDYLDPSSPDDKAVKERIKESLEDIIDLSQSVLYDLNKLG